MQQPRLSLVAHCINTEAATHPGLLCSVNIARAKEGLFIPNSQVTDFLDTQAAMHSNLLCSVNVAGAEECLPIPNSYAADQAGPIKGVGYWLIPKLKCARPVSA